MLRSPRLKTLKTKPTLPSKKMSIERNSSQGYWHQFGGLLKKFCCLHILHDILFYSPKKRIRRETNIASKEEILLESIYPLPLGVGTAIVYSYFRLDGLHISLNIFVFVDVVDRTYRDLCIPYAEV